MSSFANDLRYALRRLTATPLFSLAAVALPATGIGLNAAVFNLVDTILFRPAPFQAPEEIVHIHQDGDEGEPGSTSFPAYRDMAALEGVFVAVGATSTDGVTLPFQATPETPRSIPVGNRPVDPVSRTSS